MRISVPMYMLGKKKEEKEESHRAEIAMKQPEMCRKKWETERETDTWKEGCFKERTSGWWCQFTWEPGGQDQGHLSALYSVGFLDPSQAPWVGVCPSLAVALATWGCSVSSQGAT